MTNQSQQIALVTGGSRGLGKDMALRLAEQGFGVVLTYQSRAEAAENTVQSIRKAGGAAHALQLDVADSSGFPAFIEQLAGVLKQEFGTDKLDALVNNAGIGHHAPFANTEEAAFDLMTNIHLKAPFFLTQQLLPLLRDGGSVVNISTGLTRFTFPGYAAYAIMKAGVEALTRYQAKELGERKIRVNTVAPGAIATDFGGGAVRDNQDMNAMIAGMTALGRVGEAHDIGSVVAFLCTEEAKWINAQRIEVSGGMFV